MKCSKIGGGAHFSWIIKQTFTFDVMWYIYNPIDEHWNFYRVYNGKRRHNYWHNTIEKLVKWAILTINVRSKRNLMGPLTKGLSSKLVIESSREIWLKSRKEKNMMDTH